MVNDFGWLTIPTHPLVAVVGTFGLSMVIKAIDSYVHYRDKGIDSADAFRGELHARVAELVAQNRALQADVDMWRQKYNESFESRAMLRARHTALRLRFAELTGEEPPAEEGDEPPPGKS